MSASEQPTKDQDSAKTKSNSNPKSESWLVRHAGWLLLLGVALATSGFVLPVDPFRVLSHALRAAGVVLALASTILLFTRPIQLFGEEGGPIKADVGTFTPIFRMSYAFGLLAIVLPLIGLALPDLALIGSAARTGSTAHWEPIAALVGCDYSEQMTPDPKRPVPGMPKDLPCGVVPPQWVISVGGWILPCGLTADCLPVGTLESRAPAVPPRHVHPIVGGLVMPVYFLLIAILGSAVGLLRKLPEIQRRSDDCYVPKVAEPTQISPNVAREFVLFQFIQVITAPIIAVVAFAMIEPENTLATVLLGFAAGFSSEPFLLRIREFSETLSKSPTKTVPDDGTSLVPGQFVQLLEDVANRKAGSTGKIAAVVGDELLTVEFVEADGKQTPEPIPRGKAKKV